MSHVVDSVLTLIALVVPVYLIIRLNLISVVVGALFLRSWGDQPNDADARLPADVRAGHLLTKPRRDARPLLRIYLHTQHPYLY
jgi:hypothetical protein